MKAEIQMARGTSNKEPYEEIYITIRSHEGNLYSEIRMSLADYARAISGLASPCVIDIQKWATINPSVNSSQSSSEAKPSEGMPRQARMGLDEGQKGGNTDA